MDKGPLMNMWCEAVRFVDVVMMLVHVSLGSGTHSFCHCSTSRTNDKEPDRAKGMVHEVYSHCAHRPCLASYSF